MSYISIGKILRSYGTDGQLAVRVYSGILNRFDQIRVVFFNLSTGIEGKIIEEVRTKGNNLLLQLKEISTPEQAKMFVGKEILIPEDNKVKLPEDVFFIDDIINFSVFEESGEYLGNISEVNEMSGNDLYIVKTEERDLLIPAVSEFVKKIDMENRKMIVQLWEGF